MRNDLDEARARAQAVLTATDVLEAYATQIARDWNVKDPASGHRGFVTRFRVLAGLMARYDPKQVGAAVHREYWIPADDLHELNQNIVGLIEVIAEFPER
jgi:hypothetical protein